MSSFLTNILQLVPLSFLLLLTFFVASSSRTRDDEDFFLLNLHIVYFLQWKCEQGEQAETSNWCHQQLTKARTENQQKGVDGNASWFDETVNSSFFKVVNLISDSIFTSKRIWCDGWRCFFTRCFSIKSWKSKKVSRLIYLKKYFFTQF